MLVVISGASRGIGLEFARQYVESGAQVVAGHRGAKAPAALAALAAAHDGLETASLDVCDDASVAEFVGALGSRKADLLINNAGIVGDRASGLGSMDWDMWRATMEVNVYGPVRLTGAMTESLAGSAKVVVLSSILGSVAGAMAQDRMIYRSSKAAVNVVMRGMAATLAARGAVVFSLHPGWVRTDMGGPSATLTPEASVGSMRRTIAAADKETSGGFFDPDGKVIPW